MIIRHTLKRVLKRGPSALGAGQLRKNQARICPSSPNTRRLRVRLSSAPVSDSPLVMMAGRLHRSLVFWAVRLWVSSNEIVAVNIRNRHKTAKWKHLQLPQRDRPRSLLIQSPIHAARIRSTYLIRRMLDALLPCVTHSNQTRQKQTHWPIFHCRLHPSSTDDPCLCR